MDPEQAQRILIEHGLVALPGPGTEPASRQALATVLGNIAYYGYALSEPAYAALARADDDTLGDWWGAVDAALAAITGDDKNMGDFVVYKNFPAEVIAMDQVDYWSRQILMYWGFPDEYFTEPPRQRPEVAEKLPARVLHPGKPESLIEIRDALLRLPARWTPRQKESVIDLAECLPLAVPIGEIRFKENLVLLATRLLEGGFELDIRTATDVLRLAAGMSDGDVSLREPTRLRRFRRRERRQLLGLLERAANLEEDVARRRGAFKRLMFELHPGDYRDRFPRVVDAYDKLYRGDAIATHAGRIERYLATGDRRGLAELRRRPGGFMRRLRVAARVYGADAAEAFMDVLGELTTTQLLKTRRYLETVNRREHRTFPPRGNWTRLQIRPMQDAHRFEPRLATRLVNAIAAEIRRRVTGVVSAVRLDENTRRVKLQGNDSDLSPYGRGTVFPIPETARFIRSASFWASGPTDANLWYDNGWNFFDASWKPLGACCWNANTFARKAAVFSGDPTNSKDLNGRACQMIDLYLDKLEGAGVRYAVWNILCYSRKSFDEAVEVYAALQWGERARANKLYDPGRVALAFPVTGANWTKYIAYIDVPARELVYMDANLYGRVNSARSNQKILARTMPAFVEYLDTLPSVHDLFRDAPRADDGMPVLYDDAEVLLTGGPAYVFAPQNRHNQFDEFALDRLL